MAEYIEREALIKKLRIMPIPKQAGSANTWLDNCAAGVNAAIREVASFPAADVAPVVHGRWISWEEAGNFVPSPDRHECSVCHDAAQVLVNGLELLSDYCPNCGAKMDGGADHDA